MAEKFPGTNVLEAPNNEALEREFGDEFGRNIDPYDILSINDEDKFGKLEFASECAYEKMGVTVVEGGCIVAVAAGAAEILDVCLFNSSDRNKAEKRFRLIQGEGGVFYGFVPGMQEGDLYGFRAHGDWDPDNLKIYNYYKLLADPYARAIEGDLTEDIAVHEIIDHKKHYLDRIPIDSAEFVPRSVVVNEKSYDWEDDKLLNTPFAKTVIYEAHVKGLTMKFPGILDENRGTYAGLADPAIIAHLQKLGVTAVELLPVHHFLSESELKNKGLTNYWGYNSLSFFAPHAAYAKDKRPGKQVDEFRDMVKALHKAGIEVILDVVYNHTAEGNSEGPTLSAKGLDLNNYVVKKGNFYNHSGCGNAVSERAQQQILDSLHYWVDEMHVDGFRFDLAAALSLAYNEKDETFFDEYGKLYKAIKSDPKLSKVKLIVEPWSGDGHHALGRFPPGLLQWNDGYRDWLRDFAIRGIAPTQGELAKRLAGAGDEIDKNCNPIRVVGYITSHDGDTLYDLTAYEEKHNEANGWGNSDGHNDNRSNNHGHEGKTDDERINRERACSRRLGHTALLFGASVPMILAGDEVGNSQGGNNNAYNQDNSTSYVDWENLGDEYLDQVDYVAGLIRLRNELSIGRTKPYSSDELKWLTAEAGSLERSWHHRLGTLGMHIVHLATDAIFYISQDDRMVQLPNDGEYVVRLRSDTGEVSDMESGEVVQGSFQMRARSAVVVKRKSQKRV